MSLETAPTCGFALQACDCEARQWYSMEPWTSTKVISQSINQSKRNCNAMRPASQVGGKAREWFDVPLKHAMALGSFVNKEKRTWVVLGLKRFQNIMVLQPTPIHLIPNSQDIQVLKRNCKLGLWDDSFHIPCSQWHPEAQIQDTRHTQESDLRGRWLQQPTTAKNHNKMTPNESPILQQNYESWLQLKNLNRTVSREFQDSLKRNRSVYVEELLRNNRATKADCNRKNRPVSQEF